MSLISVQQLSVRHPGSDRLAVREVSLFVAKGEVLGIIGESGAGKSTLLRAWLGLMTPDAGRVIWFDQALATLDRPALTRLRRRVQPVFQDPTAALDPRMTVRQLLEEPLAIHGGRRAGRCEALLADVQLPVEVLSRRPAALSIGQRQRVAIARALALEPEVLLLDEPVSALDVSVQAQVLALLRELRERRGLTMVVVSHDLLVVRALASSVAVLFAGRVVEQGPADRVLDAPLHPYTRSLVGAGVAPAVDRPIAEEPGCAFRLRCPFARETCARTPALRGDAHAAACVLVKEGDDVLAQPPPA